MQRTIRNHVAAAAVLALTSLAVSTALAQSERYSVGMMQGSTIRDVVRNRDRDRGQRAFGVDAVGRGEAIAAHAVAVLTWRGRS